MLERQTKNGKSEAPAVLGCNDLFEDSRSIDRLEAYPTRVEAYPTRVEAYPTSVGAYPTSTGWMRRSLDRQPCGSGYGRCK